MHLFLYHQLPLPSQVYNQIYIFAYFSKCRPYFLFLCRFTTGISDSAYLYQSWFHQRHRTTRKAHIYDFLQGIDMLHLLKLVNGFCEAVVSTLDSEAWSQQGRQLGREDSCKMGWIKGPIGAHEKGLEPVSVSHGLSLQLWWCGCPTGEAGILCYEVNHTPGPGVRKAEGG